MALLLTPGKLSLRAVKKLAKGTELSDCVRVTLRQPISCPQVVTPSPQKCMGRAQESYTLQNVIRPCLSLMAVLTQQRGRCHRLRSQGHPGNPSAADSQAHVLSILPAVFTLCKKTQNTSLIQTLCG